MYAHTLGNVEEYMQDDDLLAHGIELGFATWDTEKDIVYDRFGVGWDRRAEGVFVREYPLADLGNYSQYHFPTIENDQIMCRAKETVEKYKDEFYLVGFQHIGLFERAWAIRGYENLMVDFYAHPELVEEILDNVLQYKLQEAEYFIKVGVDCVRTGDDWGTQANLAISPDLWRRFIKPRQERLWRRYMDAGMPIMHHSCGNIESIIPDLIEIGLDVLHPVQPRAMCLEKLSRLYSEKIIFFGGIDTQYLLPYGRPEEVKAAVKDCVELFRAGRGYIIAPSQEIMSDVPVGNIMALVKSIREYRTLWRQ